MRIKKMTVSGWKSFEHVELELSRINVLVGRNNSGKSALLRAAQFLQEGGPNVPVGEIRLGSRHASVQYTIEDYDARRYSPDHFDTPQMQGELSELDGTSVLSEVTVEVRFDVRGFPNPQIHLERTLDGKENRWQREPRIASGEPGNYIYPYLSKRKVAHYDRGVDLQKASLVTGNLQNLAAKVARLASPGNPGGVQFIELCERLLKLQLGMVVVDNGLLVGFMAGNLGTITIESMGEGVASLLGLIADLCVADGHLFLIEEPENDIHPEGLKALLDVIIEKSATNQFIVSTHSNIVVKYLASAPSSRLFSVEQHLNELGVPTSTAQPIDSPEGRSQVLRDLGYELHDFDLAEGWLILEEASAERLIRDYLIPWFAPKLTRIRTIAARGIGDVKLTFKEFAKLVLFVHREEALKERAWVVVDGDESGQSVVEGLTTCYKSWPSDRFRIWTKPHFEAYYPERFQESVSSAMSIPSKQDRQAAKSALRQAVQDWCDSEPAQAKEELAESAAEVIELLCEIEQTLFGSQ